MLRVNPSEEVGAGPLRERVTIQDLVPNPAGDEISSWTAIASDIPASVDPILPSDSAIITNRESVDGRRDVSEQWAVVRMRYRTDVNTTMRLIHGSITYDIRSVADMNSRRRFLELGCRVVL